MDRDADVPGMEAPQRVAIGILGPCMIGWTENVFLAGICFSIFYDYARRVHLSRDSPAIKAVAGIVFVLNTFIGFCCGVAILHWGTTQDRSAVGLWGQTPLDCLQSTFSGLVGFIVQGWFARRSSLLIQNSRRRNVFIGFVGTLMLCGFGGAVGVTVYSFAYASGVSNDDLVRNYAIVNSFWLWSSAIVDVINTTTLSYLLNTQVVGFNERTDNVLVKIIKLSIETALYTAVVATLAAIVSVSVNTDSYYVGDINYVFWPILPSCYALSLFTTLASRDRLAKDMSANPAPVSMKYPTITGLESRISNGVPATATQRSRQFSVAMTNVTVSVDVEVQEEFNADEDFGTDSRRWRRTRDRAAAVSLSKKAEKEAEVKEEEVADIV